MPPNPGSLGRGIAIGLGWTVLAIFAGIVFAFLTSGLAGVLLLGIGVVQAAWMVPLWRNYRRTGETETAKGILVMAGIVFLLNAGCWGLVASLALTSHNFH